MFRFFYFLAIPALLLGEDCAEDLLFRFYPKTIVLRILEENQLPKDQAAAIAEQLSTADAAVVKEIEARAAKMDPNPLLDGGAAEARGKLFKEVTTDRFMEVLQRQGITDSNRAMQMFDRIQEARLAQFEACRKMPQSKP